jgi:Uma2 family endonuclease
MMTRDISNQVGYYYDSHQTEEDKLGQTTWHSRLVSYLWDVLRWQFQDCTIYKNLNFYQTLDRMEYPIAPDLAVLKGIAFEYVRSWTVGRSGPAPNVTFEILAEETWKKNLHEKPWKYASMGVQEYFAYDPHKPPISQDTAKRLFGWQLDTKRREMVEMIPNAEGWLWSEQLDSWLVLDGIHLRLYDREHQMRLTTVEAYTKLAEEATKRSVEFSRQADEAVRRTEEARRPQEAIKRADEVTRRVQAYEEKLRALGIDPDEVV